MFSTFSEVLSAHPKSLQKLPAANFKKAASVENLNSLGATPHHLLTILLGQGNL